MIHVQISDEQGQELEQVSRCSIPVIPIGAGP